VKFLVTGAAGQLGSEIVRSLRGRETIALSHSELDVTDYHSVIQTALQYCPDVIVHSAAYTNVDGAESEPHQAFLVNGWGTRNVALAAKATGALMCYISTDFVFDGDKDSYTEWDLPAPLGVYGKSKLAGEFETMAHAPSWLIVRTAWLCGKVGRNFAKTILSLRESKATIPVVADQRGSPSVASDVAEVVAELCTRRLSGVFHVTNSGTATWYELARVIMEAAGDDPDRIAPATTEEVPRPARRPKSSILESICLTAAGLDRPRRWEDAFKELVGHLVGGEQVEGKLG
jgi:dTDP-4-dehydrorhamnose reductase